MIEANEDITLVTERQMRDVEQGRAQAKAIAEGLEIHPALLAADASAAPVATVQEMPLTVQTLQHEPKHRPADPETTFRHIRLAVLAVLVLVLLLIWIRQRKRSL